jgi:hypothetical protein
MLDRSPDRCTSFSGRSCLATTIGANDYKERERAREMEL